jgi:hypothetical protein
MKKLLLSATALALSILGMAQTELTRVQVDALFASQPNVVNYAIENRLLSYVPASTPAYSNDIIINNDPIRSQRNLRMTVAFNGWLYAAYSVTNSTADSSRLAVVRSRDNGQNWYPMGLPTSMNAGVDYKAVDLIVTGTDTLNLKLFVAGVIYFASGSYNLFVDEFNATSGVFVGNRYYLSKGSNRIYDVAIASDYKQPAVSTSPYGLGLVYSCYTSSMDSVIYIGSLDAGQTWNQRQTLATTGFYNRKVSISYGRSNSGSNGRYFVAWERLASSTSRNGNILVARHVSQVDGSFSAPKFLDSISSAAIGVCRDPQIAAMIDTDDSDSSGVSVVVLVTRDYGGAGNDHDVIGFYNKRAHFTNFWYRLDVDNASPANTMQPDVNYDPAYNNFICTYYDSTAQTLPYHVTNINIPSTSNWTVINSNYCDNGASLRAPYPQVHVNPVVSQAAHAWIAEGASNRGVAMFDAEYNFTGVQEGSDLSEASLYPNPANSQVMLSISLSEQANLRISLVNAVGQEIEVQNMERSGLVQTSFDVTNLPAGVYFVRVQSGDNMLTKRVVVTH